MCNLYSMTSKGEAERFLGQIGLDLADYEASTVGPFQTGLFVRPRKDPDTTRLVGRLGQWGMIQPDSPTRRPASRAILTNNARIEDIKRRVTYMGAWRKAQGAAMSHRGSLVPRTQLGDRQEHLVEDAPCRWPTMGAGGTVVRVDRSEHRGVGCQLHDDHVQLRWPPASGSSAQA